MTFPPEVCNCRPTCQEVTYLERFLIAVWPWVLQSSRSAPAHCDWQTAKLWPSLWPRSLDPSPRAQREHLRHPPWIPFRILWLLCMQGWGGSMQLEMSAWELLGNVSGPRWDEAWQRPFSNASTFFTAPGRKMKLEKYQARVECSSSKHSGLQHSSFMPILPRYKRNHELVPEHLRPENDRHTHTHTTATFFLDPESFMLGCCCAQSRS